MSFIGTLTSSKDKSYSMPVFTYSFKQSLVNGERALMCKWHQESWLLTSLLRAIRYSIKQHHIKKQQIKCKKNKKCKCAAPSFSSTILKSQITWTKFM